MGHPRTPLTLADLDRLDWSKGSDGLLPAVVQDAATLQVLMQAWMNRDALAETLESGEATFWSRSREARWRKGETSGNRLRVVQVLTDCDADSLLLRVEPTGPVCHEGSVSCFGLGDAPGVGWLARLEQTIATRAAADPETSYTARLLAAGPMRLGQKVGEEGVEVALAGAAGSPDQLREEAADLIYHLIVLLRARELGLQHIVSELRSRQAASDGAL
ncbi:bifunctional phosphoribosyl-AMP cyclohydrolase/phosphoribosyl-ATP diphosphatase HisIE [Brevundimonas sp.]|uniref:bifunctional phosphoribosyl-AMP cyclohydrolase/phosphoribosyl-ATP diphosphatase HisIE n=1 Tax=Brevundimonas sp. TaxID=1871086 RepID=UPI0025E8BAFC|nr:bifunctional phosphoribosyl-AMP cyclohydrolase/phosphoribosyl-ATP diphosphatase HisIE [Brevundimonas sp.]